MPGFPDKIMPFMDEPPGALLSSNLIRPYGALIRNLRKLTDHTLDKEPSWRHNRPQYTTGYDPAHPEELHPIAVPSYFRAQERQR
jgi:hydrogenase small subunit